MNADDEKKLLARMDAVKRIAKRTGYSDASAEDIASHVAVAALEGRNMDKQSYKFTFVDALREGSEGTRTRAGQPTGPVYEGHFENYADIVNGLRVDPDQISSLEDRSDVFDFVSALSKIQRTRITPLVLHFYYGWTMDQISKCAGVTESRISQLVNDAVLQAKKKVISTRLSQEKQAERERQKHRALSLKAQTGRADDGKEARDVPQVSSIQRSGVASFSVEEIPESLCRSFQVAAF